MTCRLITPVSTQLSTHAISITIIQSALVLVIGPYPLSSCSAIYSTHSSNKLVHPVHIHNLHPNLVIPLNLRAHLLPHSSINLSGLVPIDMQLPIQSLALVDHHEGYGKQHSTKANLTPRGGEPLLPNLVLTLF